MLLTEPGTQRGANSELSFGRSRWFDFVLLSLIVFFLFYDCCSFCCPAVGLESTWDDFGFPVLSCLSEAAALVLDNRFNNLIMMSLKIIFVYLIVDCC